jgi:hypothetical protein
VVQFPAGIRDLSHLQHIQTGSWTTQHHIQLQQGAPCWGIKRSGYKADHSPLSGANMKNAPSFTSTPPYAFTACAGSISLFNLRRAMHVHNCFTGYNVSYSTRLGVSTYGNVHTRVRTRTHTHTHTLQFSIRLTVFINSILSLFFFYRNVKFSLRLIEQQALKICGRYSTSARGLV